MQKNNENQFRKLIEESARKTKDIHLVPIPDDAKRMLNLHPELKNMVEEKVYDLGLLHKGKYCAVELKNENKFLTWNISEVAPHQIKYLKEASRCGGLAFVLVRFKKGLTARDKKRLNFTGFSIDKAYALDVKWLSRQKDKSLSIEFISSECLEIPFNDLTKEYDLKVLWKTRS